MKFSGLHVGDSRGHRPSGLPVHWHGAALFRFAHGRIGELWVLGDLVGLDAILRSNALAGDRGIYLSKNGMPMTDFNALMIFAAVVEATSSFSEAARRLKMTLASVSRGVADFEEQLGVLERSTRACCRRGTLRAPY